MITLLKPGYAKIMRLFYTEKTAQIHLREIARRTALHEPSTTRFLAALEKDNILVSEKDANLKKYSVRKSPKAYLVFAAYDLERFGKLPSIRQKAIRTYLGSLPEKPVFVILFGSSAKGTFNEDSDIDILIVTNRKSSAKEAEKEADEVTAMKISTFHMTYNDFLVELKMKEDKVVQSALLTGYPLINHLLYYEALYDERI